MKRVCRSLVGNPGLSIVHGIASKSQLLIGIVPELGDCLRHLINLERRNQMPVLPSLKEVGIDVGYRRVERLMRENGVVLERARKFRGEEDQDRPLGAFFRPCCG